MSDIMEMLLENKILERRLEISQREFKEALDKLKCTVETKSDALDRYESRNSQLEKWCVETQERLERETATAEETNKRSSKLTETYWEQSKSNFEHLEQKLLDYDRHLARIAELEKTVEAHTLSTNKTMEETLKKFTAIEDVERIFDDRIAKIATPHIPTNAPPIRSRRLRDTTPIFSTTLT